MSNRISVVFPVYNTKEEYLREAIESILNQTFKDFEFIILNDGSTNNAEEVILSYKDERIKYVKHENMGLARTLNKGIDLATGEFIARMDADDVSLPHRFETQVKFMDEHLDVSIISSYFQIMGTEKVHRNPKDIRYFDMMKGCKLGHPVVMMRRADMNKYNLRYDPSYLCEDYELWSRAIRYLKMANIDEILLLYRRHGENLSDASPKFKSSVEQVRSNMIDFLTDKPKWKKLIIKKFVKLSLLKKFTQKVEMILKNIVRRGKKKNK